MKIFKIAKTSGLIPNSSNKLKKAIAVSTLAALGALGASYSKNITTDIFQHTPVETLENSNEKKLLNIDNSKIKAINASLPYINNGIFNNIKLKKDTMIIDDTYKLQTKDGKLYEGRNGFWEKQSFSVEATNNENFNVIYTQNNIKQVVSFTKDNKIMDLSTAYKLNTDSTISKFYNPISKELLNSIKIVLTKDKAEKIEYENNMIKFTDKSRIKYFYHIKDLTFQDEFARMPFIYGNRNDANTINIKYYDNGNYSINLYSVNANKEIKEQSFHFDKNNKLINSNK